MPRTSQLPCEICKDMDEMLNTLKDKIKISFRRQSIQLLMLVPSSWSIEKTKDFLVLLVTW